MGGLLNAETGRVGFADVGVTDDSLYTVAWTSLVSPDANRNGVLLVAQVQAQVNEPGDAVTLQWATINVTDEGSPAEDSVPVPFGPIYAWAPQTVTGPDQLIVGVRYGPPFATSYALVAQGVVFVDTISVGGLGINAFTF